METGPARLGGISLHSNGAPGLARKPRLTQKYL